MNCTRTAIACAAAAAGLINFVNLSHAAPAAQTVTGSILFQAVMIPNPSPLKDPTCPFIGINVGSGTVAPFGQVSFYSTECVAPNAAIPANLDASKGVLVLTTTNGQVINGTYSGTFVGNTTGSYIANAMPFNIIGGTGKYANASGSGTLFISQGATGVGTIVPTGSLTY